MARMVELGDFINNYRILSKVADSSVSSTYIAEQIPAGTSPVLLTLWHGVRLTASEDIQTFLKKARHGVLLKNSQTIPLLDAQLYYQSPYIVTALNANTSLDAHTPLINQVIDKKKHFILMILALLLMHFYLSFVPLLMKGLFPIVIHFLLVTV
jgi:hypothetical protein